MTYSILSQILSDTKQPNVWKPHVEVFIKTKDTEIYNKPGLFRRGFGLPLYMYLNY